MDTAVGNFSALDLRLRSLLGNERRTQVEFLLAFGEFERSRGFAELGYGSVWDYGSRELKLLKGQVYRRVHSARILRIAPRAAEYLLDGRMSMTTLAMLKDVISTENADEFLERCAGRSKDEVEFIVRCAEAKVVSKKEVLRRMPARPVKDPLMPDAEASARPGEETVVVEQQTVQLPPKRVEIVQALSAEQYLLKILVAGDFVEMLEKARNYLSHKVPDGSIEGVLREALSLVLSREAAKHGPKAPRVKRQAKTKAPARTAEVLPAELVGFLSRTHERAAVPVATLRRLWEEEGGVCTAPLTNGGICGSRWQLEPDHKIPVARGGTNDRENLRLRCRAHNLQAARDVFGDAWMDRWRKKK